MDTDKKNAILEFVRNNNGVTNNEISDALEIRGRDVIDMLDELIDDGCIRIEAHPLSVNSNESTYYFYTGKKVSNSEECNEG